MGFFLSLFTGDIFPVMYVAVFFELLWVDIIPAGTFIPPNAIFCVVATICLMEIFGLTHTSQILATMIMTIPIAFLSSWLEGIERTGQNKNYNVILQQTRKAPARYRPDLMIRTSVLRSFFIYLITGLLGIYLLMGIFSRIHIYIPLENVIQWPHLLLIASVSALAALRIKKAYISLILGMVLIAAYIGKDLLPL